jgi:hypothetical protein
MAADSALSEQIRHQAMQLIEASPKWKALPWLFRLATDANEGTSKLGVEGLRNWLGNFSKTFSLPNSDEKNAIRKHFAECCSSLDPFLFRQFNHLLENSVF